MEKNVDAAAIARNEARGAMVAERMARREAMAAVAGGGGKLARKVSAMMLDQDGFDDWVCEKGGEFVPGRSLAESKKANAAGFMTWFCAQVAAGVPPKVLCEHYMQEMGLLGAFLAEEPGRLEQFYRAQQWAAQGLVDEAYEEAWDDGPDVVRSKLRVSTNMQIAGKYDRPRFGEEKQVGVPGVPVLNFVMADGSSLVLSAPDDPARQLPEKQVVAEQVVEPDYL